MIKLSFSKVSTYIECPRKYFLSYVANLGTGSSPYMSNGSAIHKVAEDFPDFDKKDKTLEQMIKYYRKVLPENDPNNLVHESIGGDIIIDPRFEEKAIKSLKTIYDDMTANFYEQNRVDYEPNIIQREQWFELNLPDGHKIRGLIDRIDLEDENSKDFSALDSNIYLPEHIVDYKSGQSRATFKAVENPLDIKSMQLAIYSLARYKETGKIPYKSSFFYVEPNKNAKKQVGQYRSAPPRTLEQLLKVEEFLNNIANEIEELLIEQKRTGNEMFPTGDNPNCFFCDFNKKCDILSNQQIIEFRQSIAEEKSNSTKLNIDMSDWN